MGTATCDFRYGYRREATTAPHSRNEDVPSHCVKASPAPSVVTFYRDKARCKPSGRNERPNNRESVELNWRQNEALDGYTGQKCRCQHRCWYKQGCNPERRSIHTGHFENKRSRALTELSAFQKSSSISIARSSMFAGTFVSSGKSGKESKSLFAGGQSKVSVGENHYSYQTSLKLPCRACRRCDAALAQWAARTGSAKWPPNPVL